jgi:hypothetical protein
VDPRETEQALSLHSIILPTIAIIVRPYKTDFKLSSSSSSSVTKSEQINPIPKLINLFLSRFSWAAYGT